MKKVMSFIFFALMTSNIFAGDIKYGHPVYEEADKSKLVKAGEYPNSRPKMLKEKAYKQLKDMIKAAQKDGVNIKLLSAFRSITHQKYLFERAVKLYGSEEEAAKRVAPPGHSQHHTGKAVDLGDESAPETDLIQEFDGTKAYKWLVENAEKYRFYLSFPKDNPQGVMYEPWHWCYKENPKMPLEPTYEVGE